MTKLYKKNEITFTVVWIVAYVLLSSVADNVSADLGVAKSITAVLHVAMVLILYFWIRKNGLMNKYGLCKPSMPVKNFLYYIPLAVIASASLRTGIGLRFTVPETLYFVVSMLCVGFIEEVIFRGFLFRALEKDNLKTAIIVSSLTFGLGHISNLFNGSGRTPASSAVQIIFAVLVGLVLVTIFYRGGSLIPCIVFHSVNNALGAFGAEGQLDQRTEMIINLILIVIVLGGYLLYLYRIAPRKE